MSYMSWRRFAVTYCTVTADTIAAGVGKSHQNSIWLFSANIENMQVGEDFRDFPLLRRLIHESFHF